MKTMMKSGGAMKKQAATAVAMKKAGKAPKKAMMGTSMDSPMMDSTMMKKGGKVKKAASMKPKATMKSGGAMKKCKFGCK